MTDPTLVKCLVWDLDHTLWDGVLLEDGEVNLRPGVAHVVDSLDRRGILQSIASRSDPQAAQARLVDLGLGAIFLHPQIHWGSKVASVREIASSLKIGTDAVALIDDDPFERDEVRHSLPAVRCYPASAVDRILERPEFRPRVVTEDGRRRRELYQRDLERARAEREHTGTSQEFLAGLDMRLTISEAADHDLLRAEELTVRTHQLNTTGVTYSYEELERYRSSDRYRLLMVELDDRYGSYGKIGLALVRCDAHVWTIKLLLMSCRVISRGVGSILVRHLVDLAAAAKVRLQAEFVANERNRMMHIAYRFSGFEEVGQRGEVTILESVATRAPAIPDYVTVGVSPT